jgi:predicted nucleic acid-binding protein
VAVTEPIVMEVLAGARDDRREADLRRLLLAFELLPFDAVADFDGAVRIYRRCRAQGAHDADMSRVAELAGVELDTASPRAAP